MSPQLQALFQRLDALPGPAPLARLVGELVGCPVSCRDVAGFLRFSDRGYRRNPLRAGVWYQAWVLCWRSGQRSPVHDHTGSACAVRVLRGTLTETVFGLAPNGQARAAYSRDWPAGSVLASEDADMHQVSNLQPEGDDLVTLHVYSPPLRAMGTYALEGPGRGVEVWEEVFSESSGI